jgi:hypothetical protein
VRDTDPRVICLRAYREALDNDMEEALQAPPPRWVENGSLRWLCVTGLVWAGCISVFVWLVIGAFK